MALCTECEAEITLESSAEVGEIIQCPDCGLDLEVISVEPAEVGPGPGGRGGLGRMRIGILCSLVRKEEKLLFDAFRSRGLDFVRLDDREVILDLHQRRWEFDVILERCINHSRALHTLRYFNDCGVKHRQHLRGRQHLRRQAAHHARPHPGRGPDPTGARGPHARVRLAGHRAAGLPGRPETGRGVMGPLALQGQRPGSRRGDPGAQGNAGLLPPQHLLHPEVRREARAGHPVVRRRRRNHLRHLSDLSPLDHQHRARAGWPPTAR